MPTYQQLYSIPEAIGAEVAIMHLKQENDYLPDLEELKALVTPETKMICINNPNNPTGALMSETQLQQIVDIARSVDAYILCDEVYRHLTQTDDWCPSIADLYEKGISVSSMSKVFSLAGLRMGWIATRDETARKAFLSHRDYNLISCGMFDDAVASIALAHSDRMLKRNQTKVFLIQCGVHLPGSPLFYSAALRILPGRTRGWALCCNPLCSALRCSLRRSVPPFPPSRHPQNRESLLKLPCGCPVLRCPADQTAHSFVRISRVALPLCVC